MSKAKWAALIIVIGIVALVAIPSNLTLPSMPSDPIQALIIGGSLFGIVVVIVAYFKTNPKPKEQDGLQYQPPPIEPFESMHSAAGMGKIPPNTRKEPTTTPHFCPDCGTRINSRFCPNCGLDVLAQSSAVAEQSQRVERRILPAYLECPKCGFGAREDENKFLILPIHTKNGSFIRYMCPRCLTPTGDPADLDIKLKPSPEVVSRVKRMLKDQEGQTNKT